MKKHRIISAVGLLVMIAGLFLTALPASVRAETEGDYTYRVTNEKVTITGYNGPGGDIAIPDTLGGYPVIAIDEYAFYYEAVTNVTIGDNITFIGECAFSYCSNLLGIWVSDSNAVYSSDENGVLFNKDKTDIITFPGGVIGDYVIPEGVETICDYAFAWCAGPQKLTIPHSIVEIQERAFYTSIGVREIYYDGTQDRWASLTADLYSSSLYGVNVYAGRCGENVKWKLDNDGTLTIFGSGAMENYEYGYNNVSPWGTEITAVIISEGVTSVGDYAFYECADLRSITIAEGVTSIGQNAFYNCESLSKISIPSSLEKIGGGAFEGCDSMKFTKYNNGMYIGNSKDPYVLFLGPTVTGIKNFILHENTKFINDRAFYNYGLTSITLPNEILGIGDAAFANCTELKLVNFGKSLISIGDSAFWSCMELQAVALPDSVEKIGDYAFYYCREMESVTIGTGVSASKSATTIGECAFFQCERLSNVFFGNRVKSIDREAFAFCEDLWSVTIGKGLETIGDSAFRDSKYLYDVYYIGSESQWNDIYIGSNNKYLLSADVYYNIKPATITKQPTDAFAVNGKTVSAKVTATGDGLSYAWYFQYTSRSAYTKTTIKSNTFSVQMYADYHGAKVYCVVTDKYGNSFKTDEVYTRNSAQITVQPKNTAIPNGKTAKVTVSATGDGLSYIWYYAKKGETLWNKSSSNTNTFTTDKMSSSYDGTRVYCVVSDKYGNSAKSAVVTLSLGTPVKITIQPVNVAVANGKTAKVTVSASGDGLKYQWYYAKKGSSTYTKASTTATYSVKMSSSINGGKVYCVVSDAYGNSVKSNVVTLYKGTPAKITTQPKSTTVANGKSGSITLKASGSSLKYQWYIKYKGASAFTKIGKSSKTYSFKMASKLDGAQAYCVVKDKYGIEVKSSTVTIKMPVQPKITTQPKSVKAFSGKTVKFTVKASGDGLKYQWYYAKEGSSSFKKLSAKSATYSVKVSSSVDGRKYYCLVTDKYGQTVKSSVVTLTMQKAAKILTQPKKVSVKNGKAAKVTIKAEGDGLKYTWYYQLSGQAKFQKASATGNAFSVTMSAKYKNAKVYCAISDQYGNTVKSKTVTLKMK